MNRRSFRPSFRPRVVLGLIAALFLGAPTLAAHEIPADVIVRAFLKPEGQQLTLLLRVPLESMRDINFPVRGPGFLEIDQVDPLLYAGARLWIADMVRIYENGEQIMGGGNIVSARVSLPADQSFATWDGAMAHINGERLPAETEIIWQQAMMDVMITYPIQSSASEFSIYPGLEHLGMETTTVLHFLPEGSPERVFQYTGDPGLIRLDPAWYYAAGSFVKMGFEHILGGIDHLLFVFLLVVPIRRMRPLLAMVTAFTLAHSVTLIASALGMAPSALWFPPLIETLIALSIVLMALENIIGANPKHRWVVAFLFGLVHGFGFSFALRESLQFAGSHLLVSLLSFNVGVELGQILVIALCVPALALLYKYVVERRLGEIILSALVAHVAWHWMSDRYAQFSAYPIHLPEMGMLFVAALMRWAMIGLILWVVIRLLSRPFGKLMGQDGGAGSPGGAEPEQQAG
jgi:hypothetical protein